MSKKKILLLTAIILCLAFAVGGTIAYFTGSETTHNVITTGNVNIELIEQARTDTGLIPFENVEGIMPGVSVSKIVTVQNVGVGTAWVRIAVEKSIQLAAGVTGEADPSLLVLDIDTANWTEKDGYYYYAQPLNPGETTTALFTTVTFDESMGNQYQKGQAHINIKAEAVQTANNGSTVLEALGWPTE